MSGGLFAFVPGIPRPQGSKNAFNHAKTGRVVQVESSRYVKTWRDDIRGVLVETLACSTTWAGAPVSDAVEVQLDFLMPRPKGHFRTGRNSTLLRTTAPSLPIGKPDIDKLTRSVLDAIGSAGAWKDDAQVWSVKACKVYAAPHQAPGVNIRIYRLLTQEDR